MPKLTETAIASATKRAVASNLRLELADPDHRGLRLRITGKGSRSWILGCRDGDGKARRYPLGDYPKMGLSEAREAARETRAGVKKGADPIAVARSRRTSSREAGAGIGTLAALLDLYATQRGASLKSWPDCRQRVSSVFGVHLEKPLGSLNRLALQSCADGWRSPQSAAAAVRYLRPILKWAAFRNMVAADLVLIAPPAKVIRRQRVLASAELQALLPVLRASDRPYAAAMRFLLLTLARREEAGAARWRHIDFDAGVWTIPETKNGQPHQVPLSRQAAELLRWIKPPKAKPDGLVFPSTAGTLLTSWDRETKTIMKASGTSGWTRHDLRRTGATMLGEMGEMPEIIEAALNHATIRSPLAATYNRSRYRPQVAAALQRLGDAIEQIGAQP